MVYVIIAVAVVSFVAGALVFRNNSTAANKAIASGQAVAGAVSTAATTVAAEVKKA